MFAKTDKALTRLTKMVKDRKVNKTYLAIVKNAPKTPSATLENYIKKNEKQNKSYIVKEGTKDSKIAVLDYSVVGYSSGGYTLLEVHLHTGRHHQIRTQLSNIGSPIRGDLKYGYPRSNPDGSISLHSYKLEFEHPIKKEIITLEAKPITKDALWSAFF
jgi:23S rRNA pseudouridine1911/1915/1917 synthase